MPSYEGGEAEKKIVIRDALHISTLDRTDVTCVRCADTHAKEDRFFVKLAVDDGARGMRWFTCIEGACVEKTLKLARDYIRRESKDGQD